MKKTLFTLLLISGFLLCKAQFSFEIYYPEKVLLSYFEKARTPERKIYMAGELALYNIMYCRDSLSNIYIQKAYDIAASTQEPRLIATAKWWDAYVHASSIAFDYHDYTTARANELLQYADQYHFLDYKIAAYNVLSDINIHYDLNECEKNIITANLWIDDVHDDSLKIEVYNRLAHVFIHKRDGIKASRYFMKMLDYIEQDDNIPARNQANNLLANLYFEIGETQKSIALNKILYQYYIQQKLPCETYAMISNLAIAYGNTSDKVMETYYLNRCQVLSDSLNVVNFYSYWHATYRYYYGLIKLPEIIELLKGNFGNRFAWPRAKVYYDIAQLYLSNDKLDSAEYYYGLSKANGVDKLAHNFVDYDMAMANLHFQKKDYKKSIEEYLKLKSQCKEKSNINGYLSCLNGLVRNYKGMDDYKTAWAYKTEYTTLSDSLDKLNNQQEITLMEMQKNKEIDARKKNEKEEKLAHRHNVQYMGMAIGAGIILLFLFLLGLVDAKPWLINLMSFFSFIFIFEFLILILDNEIHHLTEGEPWKIIIIKVVLIALIYPLHHFVEERVSHHLIHSKINLGKGIRTIWGSGRAGN